MSGHLRVVSEDALVTTNGFAMRSRNESVLLCDTQGNHLKVFRVAKKIFCTLNLRNFNKRLKLMLIVTLIFKKVFNIHLDISLIDKDREMYCEFLKKA